MNQKEEKLIEIIQGLSGVVSALIGRLEANKLIQFSELANGLKVSLSDMSEEDRSSGTGFIFERYVDLLESLDANPDDQPPNPDWFKGIIDGGKKD